MGLRNDFAAKGEFQPISMPNAILAANGENINILAAPFEAWKSFPQRGENFGDGGFSQRRMGDCKIISQREEIFAVRALLLRNLAAHALSLLFELLLIPNFLLSPLLTFLLIFIIQKPMLHKNKLELKH